MENLDTSQFLESLGDPALPESHNFSLRFNLTIYKLRLRENSGEQLLGIKRGAENLTESISTSPQLSRRGEVERIPNSAASGI
jgi:hypothetical protein